MGIVTQLYPKYNSGLLDQHGVGCQVGSDTPWHPDQLAPIITMVAIYQHLITYFKITNFALIMIVLNMNKVFLVGVAEGLLCTLFQRILPGLNSDFTDTCISRYSYEANHFRSGVRFCTRLFPLPLMDRFYHFKDTTLLSNYLHLEDKDVAIEIDTKIVIMVSPTTWEGHHSPRAKPDARGKLPRSSVWPHSDRNRSTNFYSIMKTQS